jgi:HK97 gp10 family phage protein
VSSNKVNIKGMSELEKKLRELPALIRSAGARAVKAETKDTAQDMRRGAPFKTGKLREGIQEEFDPKTQTGRAVSTARHTTFVVHGTSDTPANDFITPAAIRARKRFPERVKREIGRELGKL